MYSRNYGFSNDTPAKINPPPSYAGSVISRPAPTPEESDDGIRSHGEETKAEREYAPPCKEEEEPRREEKEEAHRCADPCERTPRTAEKKGGILSGIFSGMSTEDLILLGIIAALALGLCDSDILLVALVVAVVLM